MSLREVSHAGAPCTDALPLSIVSSHVLVKPRICPEARESTRRSASPPPINGAISNQVAGPGTKPSMSVKLPVRAVPLRSNHCPRMHPLHCA